MCSSRHGPPGVAYGAGVGSAGGPPDWGNRDRGDGHYRDPPDSGAYRDTPDRGTYRSTPDRGAYHDADEQRLARARSAPTRPPARTVPPAGPGVPRRVGIALAVGLVGIPFGILAPVAIMLGTGALDDARGTDHEGVARAAQILGIVGTTLWLAFLGLIVLGAMA